MAAKKRTAPDAAGGKAAVFTRQLEYQTEEGLDLVNVTEDVVRAVAEERHRPRDRHGVRARCHRRRHLS
ncbi:MAG: hypothetical protein M1309_06830 [Actinobacteria bacterium]|nr:hypothetical protein [Actinomycetota bacterium]